MTEQNPDLIPVAGSLSDGTIVSGLAGSAIQTDVLTAARIVVNEHSSIKVGETPVATVWCVGRDGSVYSISSEKIAARLAEDYFDHAIYFFATLV